MLSVHICRLPLFDLILLGVLELISHFCAWVVWLHPIEWHHWHKCIFHCHGSIEYRRSFPQRWLLFISLSPHTNELLLEVGIGLVHPLFVQLQVNLWHYSLVLEPKVPWTTTLHELIWCRRIIKSCICILHNWSPSSVFRVDVCRLKSLLHNYKVYNSFIICNYRRFDPFS